jgi:prepilin-type N-terminal cleavage/methylation domain-containing protein
MEKVRYQLHKKSNQGFSLPELIIAVLILAIVTTLSLMGITRAQSSFQLSNGAETLKVYVEKAFSDAKRRHAQGDVRAKIQVTSTTTYQVTIDFNGDGVAENRTISLPQKVTFVYNPANPPVATIDWRGNVAEGNVVFSLKSDQNQTLELELTGNGDTNIKSEFPTLPTVGATPNSSDVSNSTVLVGNSTSDLNPSPTPTPTPLPFCSGGQKPAIDICRCPAGKIIKDDGKCG